MAGTTLDTGATVATTISTMGTEGEGAGTKEEGTTGGVAEGISVEATMDRLTIKIAVVGIAKEFS